MCDPEAIELLASVDVVVVVPVAVPQVHDARVPVIDDRRHRLPITSNDHEGYRAIMITDRAAEDAKSAGSTCVECTMKLTLRSSEFAVNDQNMNKYTAER